MEVAGKEVHAWLDQKNVSRQYQRLLLAHEEFG